MLVLWSLIRMIGKLWCTDQAYLIADGASDYVAMTKESILATVETLLLFLRILEIIDET